MSVYQVEEYYIHMEELTMSEKQEEKIKELFSEELFNEDYLIIREEGLITVGNFEDAYMANYLEEKIKEILEND